MWDAIRKFGLEYCDLPTMIWNVSVMLRILTLDIDSRYTKRIPIINYIFTVLWAASYYYVFQVSMLWFVFIRSPQTGDLVAAMVVLSLGVASMIGPVKIIFMYSNMKKLRQTVSEYLEHDACTVPGTRFSRNLMKSLRNVKKRVMCIWILIMVNAVAYIIMPAFLSGRHLMEDMYVIYGLEPMFETPNYEIAMLLTAVGILFICFAATNITAFMIIIVGYTEAQMLSLSEELVNVWDDAIQEYYYNTELKNDVVSTLFRNTTIVFGNEGIKKINIGVKKRLVQIIQNHARNIRLLGQVEDIFRVSIAAGFVFLIVGIIAELLGGIENTFLQIPFALSHVAIDCWTGQKIMDASVMFARAVYECKWENFDQQNMKIVLVILHSSQKTLTLSVGGMVMLSFSCLMSILRNIYSAYTTLRSMINNPD